MCNVHFKGCTLRHRLRLQCSFEFLNYFCWISSFPQSVSVSWYNIQVWPSHCAVCVCVCSCVQLRRQKDTDCRSAEINGMSLLFVCVYVCRSFLWIDGKVFAASMISYATIQCVCERRFVRLSIYCMRNSRWNIHTTTTTTTCFYFLFRATPPKRNQLVLFVAWHIRQRAFSNFCCVQSAAMVCTGHLCEMREMQRHCKQQLGKRFSTLLSVGCGRSSELNVPIALNIFIHLLSRAHLDFASTSSYAICGTFLFLCQIIQRKIHHSSISIELRESNTIHTVHIALYNVISS